MVEVYDHDYLSFLSSGDVENKSGSSQVANGVTVDELLTMDITTLELNI